MALADLNSPFPVSSRGSGRRRRMLALQAAVESHESTVEPPPAATPAQHSEAPRLNPARAIGTRATGASAAIDRIRELVDDTTPRTWVFTGDGFGFETRLARRSWIEHFTDVVRSRLARGKDVVLDTTASRSSFASLLRNLDWQVLRFQPDVVVISAGPDDVLRAETSRDSLQAALTELTEFLNDEGCVVILCSPPLAAGLSRQQAEPLLDTLRSVAEQCQTVFVDHYAMWQTYQAKTGGQLDLLDSSETVPSAAGHRKLARDLINELGIARSGGQQVT